MAEDPQRDTSPGARQDDGLEGLPELAGRWRRCIAGIPAAWHELFRFPSDRPPRKLNREGLLRIGSVALVIMLGWAVGFLIGLLNPIGIERTSATYSAALVARMTAPFYASAAQDHIAVVLIDQSTLDARDISWPPRYGYYEEVLRRVNRYRPRAVFFDVLLADSRKYDDSLQDTRQAIADDLAETPVPVLFSRYSPGTATLLDGVPGVSTAVAGWAHLEDRYPLSVDPDTALGLFGDAVSGGEKCDGQPAAATVALRLYDLACAKGQVGCAESASLLDQAHRCAAMNVVWGRRPPLQTRQNPKLMESCARDIGRLKQSLELLWRSILAGLLPDMATQALQPCPYTLTLHEQQLENPQFGALLKDRVVLIGVRLAGMDDSVISPVHGRLGGVYLHAMALDNLMTYGHRFYAGGGGWPEQMLVAAVLSLLLACLLWFAPPFTRGWMLLAGLIFAALWWFVMSQLLRHPPINWLWLLGTFFFVVEHVRREGHRAPPGVTHSKRERTGES